MIDVGDGDRVVQVALRLGNQLFRQECPIPAPEEHGDVAGWAGDRILDHDIFDAVAGEITHRNRKWTSGRVKAALRLERAVAQAQKYRDVARVVVGDDDVGDAVAGEVRDDHCARSWAAPQASPVLPR